MKLNDTEALAYIAKKMGFRSLRRYEVKSKFLFRKLPVEGRRVLEVGCGRGTFALWAAMHNAEYVLGIEPETAGSTTGSLQILRSLISELNLGDRLEAKCQLLQDLPVPKKPFDIVVMYNVINHIDEKAVEHLHEDFAAVASYVKILHHLRSLMTPDGIVIVGDCARSNFWNAIGKPSPFITTIEWYKHQNPKIWIDVFSRSGFSLHDFSWSRLYPLGRLAANRFVQYMTCSHFLLRFRVKESA